MKKPIYIIIVILLLLGAFVGIFAYINQDKLIDRFIERQTKNSTFRYDFLEDRSSIRLVTVGTSAPIPSDRVQTCNGVFVNGKFFVFDLGEGALDKMEDLRLPIDKVENIFISHWHSDHFVDLPGFINRSWQMGRQQEVNVYGPKGVRRILAGIDSMMFLENSYRVAHHGSGVMNPDLAKANPIEISSIEGEKNLVYSKDDVKIYSYPVSHHPVEPSFAFRIEYQDKVLVIGGDTAYDKNLADFAKGADILVHEVMQKDFIKRATNLQEDLGNLRNVKILTDILDYHSTPKEAAQIANLASVKKLVLSHFAPPPENPISRRFYTIGLGDIYKGPVLLAEDGDVYTIN